MTMASDGMVTATITAVLHTPGSQLPLQSVWIYDVRDPYAVTVRFDVGNPEPVEWQFARELTEDGLKGEAGRGDVHILTQGESLSLRLTSPFGTAHFVFGSDSIRHFLRATYILVPAGKELDFLNIDKAISDLFS